MKYHVLAFVFGFLLDMILGDPYWLPHPIRLIGNLIAKLEKCLLPESAVHSYGKVTAKKYQLTKTQSIVFFRGVWLVIIVILLTTLTTALILVGLYFVHPYAGLVAETIMTYQILAAKSLKNESMKVYRQLKIQNVEGARMAVSMIVGRDTTVLDDIGIIKAAVETVAENTSDGVIAPMLFTAIGGPILGFFYKAVNTMDSMVGYKSDKYLYFGRAAAKLDDFVNYIPARISAYLMIIAAFLGGNDFSGRRAYLIYKRDRRKHASPNSAQTESVCAGALGIQLAGDAVYFGKTVKKPYIGDAVRSVEYEDIRRVNRLMYLTAGISEVLCLILMLVIS